MSIVDKHKLIKPRRWVDAYTVYRCLCGAVIEACSEDALYWVFAIHLFRVGLKEGRAEMQELVDLLVLTKDDLREAIRLANIGRIPRNVEITRAALRRLDAMLAKVENVLGGKG